MIKGTFFVTLLAGITGIILLLPATPGLWMIYSAVLVVHILSSLLLLGMIAVVSVGHARKAARKSKKVKRKRSGLIYLTLCVLTITSGLFISITSGFSVVWMLPLHLVVGIWCIIFAWKHSVIKNVKTNAKINSNDNLQDEIVLAK